MIKKIFGFVIALLLLVAAGGYGYLNFYNGYSSLATGDKVKFTVKEGMTTAEIATMLHDLKLINEPTVFRLAVKAQRLDNKLQAGNYEVTAGMSDQEIIKALTTGKTRFNKFSVPEGSTVKDIARKLEKEHLGSADAFMAAAKSYAPYPYMDTADPNVPLKAEGFACPSTYYLPENAKEQDILAMMVKEFDKQLTPEMRNDVMSSHQSLRDIVNMAAMVEREATFKEEMPLIAGVFIKRVRMGMPIQSDTTIQYILGEQKKEITFEDLKLDSPYNTYTHKGLPPGPIANPSMDALRAVLHPVITDYLYFVADKDGHHQFTKTYEEHLAMIKKINGDTEP